MSSCQPPKRGEIGRLRRQERLFSVFLFENSHSARNNQACRSEIQSSKRKSQWTVGFRRMCVEDTHCQTAAERATLSGLEDEGDQNTEPSVGL